MKSLDYLRYVFGEMEAPVGTKLRYLGEKVLKVPVLKLNRLLGLELPLPYLLREDYTLRNRYGTWRICAGSDFDYAVNPLHEQVLEPFFRCEGQVFLDIGAHIGKWSVFVARAQPAVQVYAFEPHPVTFRYLQQNLLLNGLKNVLPVHAAISSRKGQALLETPRVNTEMSRLVAAPGGKDVVQISTRGVDEFLAEQAVAPTAVGLVKIDVEGHELEVLRGMRGLLERASGLPILCEILPRQQHSQAIFRFMEALGYEATPLPTRVDYLFRRPGERRPR